MIAGLIVKVMSRDSLPIYGGLVAINYNVASSVLRMDEPVCGC
jgi:hypothetical protein